MGLGYTAGREEWSVDMLAGDWLEKGYVPGVSCYLLAMTKRRGNAR